MKKKDENKVQQECWLHIEEHYPDLIMHSVVNGFGVTIPKSIPITFHDKIRQIIAMHVDLLSMIGMKKGVADTMIHGKNGRVIWCEFKTLSGVQAKAQKRLQDKVEKNGGVYIMPRSIEDFKEKINIHLDWLMGKE